MCPIGKAQPLRGQFRLPPCRKAFTLVELLVVIGIIVVLISLLLPALSRSRNQANTIKCLANEKQLLNALHLYLTDNDNWMPFPNWRSLEVGPKPPVGWLYNYANGITYTTADLPSGSFWLYLGDAHVYRCPADDGPWPAGTTQNETSYVMNGAVCNYGTQPFYKVVQFETDSIIFWEVDANNASAGNDGSNTPDEAITNRHQAGTTVGYLDGHAGVLTQGDWSYLLTMQPGALWCYPQ